MTQCDKLHEMLKRGPVSGMDCINAGIMNYKGRVNDLRKLGVPIKTEMVTRTNTAGEKKTFAIYSLEVKNVNEIQDMLKSMVPDAIKALKEILNDKSATPTTRVRAASLLRRYLSEFDVIQAEDNK